MKGKKMTAKPEVKARPGDRASPFSSLPSFRPLTTDGIIAGKDISKA